jgi:hydroxymethylbilane synthase
MIGRIAVGRSKQIAVGSRGDTLAACYLERVLAALREIHPQATFVDVRGERASAKMLRGKSAGKDREAVTFDAACAPESSRKRSDARKWPAAFIHKLVRNELDVVIMDARWIPLQLPAPVEIAAILERTNPFDALLSCEDRILDEQPENALIGASEPVKRGQLLYYRPDLKLVETSDDFIDLFAMMRRGEVGGFVFPASDIEALNQQENVVEVFTTSICTPLAGQGALALLARRDQKDVFSILRHLNDPSTAAEVELERMFLEVATKDGRGPVGVLGNVEANEFELEAAIASPDGSEKIAGGISGHLVDRARVVGKLAGELLLSGGGEIIAAFKKGRGTG